MRPLSEWSDEELRNGILFIGYEVYRKMTFLNELLRRERTKVAAEVRAFPRCDCRARGFCECYGYGSFDRLADQIEVAK